MDSYNNNDHNSRRSNDKQVNTVDGEKLMVNSHLNDLPAITVEISDLDSIKKTSSSNYTGNNSIQGVHCLEVKEKAIIDFCQLNFTIKLRLMADFPYKYIHPTETNIADLTITPSKNSGSLEMKGFLLNDITFIKESGSLERKRIPLPFTCQLKDSENSDQSSNDSQDVESFGWNAVVVKKKVIEKDRGTNIVFTFFVSGNIIWFAQKEENSTSTSNSQKNNYLTRSKAKAIIEKLTRNKKRSTRHPKSHDNASCPKKEEQVPNCNVDQTDTDICECEIDLSPPTQCDDIHECETELPTPTQCDDIHECEIHQEPSEQADNTEENNESPTTPSLEDRLPFILGDQIEVFDGGTRIDRGSFIFIRNNTLIWADSTGYIRVVSLEDPINIRKI